MLSQKLLLIPLLLLAFACKKASKNEKQDSTKTSNTPKTIKTIDRPPPTKQYKKIVTIGKTITQIVFALGEGKKVVAVDRKSSNDSLPLVGYGRILRSELVLKHEPDLVLSDIEGSSEEIMNDVAAEDIDYIRYHNSPNIDSTKALIREIAWRLNKKPAGEKLITSMDSTLNTIPDIKKGRKDTVRVMYVLARGVNLVMAGQKTAGDAIIRLAIAKNATNVLAIEGMKRLTPEVMMRANPDYILMSDKSWNSVASKIFEIPALFDSRARRLGRIIHMDEHALTGFGLDTPKAAAELCKKLYK